MPLEPLSEHVGSVTSPGGFVFGVQGWVWPEPKPMSITFFLDGTCKVSDQHGRPIKGSSIDGKQVYFAQSPPIEDELSLNQGELPPSRKKYGNHEQVLNALEKDGHNWRKVAFAGWPQLPYEKLVCLKDVLPKTPIEELRKIRDPKLRKDAIKVRREIIEQEEECEDEDED